MFKSLSIAALALLSATAMAQHVERSFTNDSGEQLFVESRDNNTAFSAVVAAIEKAGYRQVNPGGYGKFISPDAKYDTWCKVDVYLARQILGECYTPQLGHGVTVRDSLTWSQHSFKGDYTGVAPMITKIRDEHRHASAALGIK